MPLILLTCWKCRKEKPCRAYPAEREGETKIYYICDDCEEEMQM
jgi:hypothetical protein